MTSNVTTSGKRVFVLLAGLMLLGGGGVLAQTAKPDPAKPPTSVAPVPTRGPGPMAGPGTMGAPGPGGHMPGGHMPGGHMMRGGGMGMGAGPGMMGGMGMCPLMGGPDAKVEVKKLPKGVSITITADDPRAVSRIQKVGEAMRLMHEAASE